jgi:DNA-binding NtrC family response regulator
LRLASSEQALCSPDAHSTPAHANNGSLNIIDAATGGDPGHLREVERRHVLEILEQHRGNKVHAARALGISLHDLYRLSARHGLEDGRVASP